MLLHLRGNGHALARQDRDDPAGRPGAFVAAVDTGERLERNGIICAVRHAAEVVPVTALGERGGPDRTTEVEGEDLGALVAPELLGHEREQHGFARARRAVILISSGRGFTWTVP